MKGNSCWLLFRHHTCHRHCYWSSLLIAITLNIMVVCDAVIFVFVIRFVVRAAPALQQNLTARVTICSLNDDNNNNKTTAIIITNLIHIAQFDTNGMLTALYIVKKYMQTHYVHLCMDIFAHIYRCTHIYINRHMYKYIYIYTERERERERQRQRQRETERERE